MEGTPISHLSIMATCRTPQSCDSDHSYASRSPIYLPIVLEPMEEAASAKGPAEQDFTCNIIGRIVRLPPCQIQGDNHEILSKELTTRELIMEAIYKSQGWAFSYFSISSPNSFLITLTGICFTCMYEGNIIHVMVTIRMRLEVI